jgi:hypothetical protein
MEPLLISISSEFFIKAMERRTIFSRKLGEDQSITTMKMDL